MIDRLIAGKVLGDPEQRIGKGGKPFVVAKVRAQTSLLEPVTFAESRRIKPKGRFLDAWTAASQRLRLFISGGFLASQSHSFVERSTVVIGDPTCADKVVWV